MEDKNDNEKKPSLVLAFKRPSEGAHLKRSEREASTETIAELERLLAAARAGELLGLAWAAVYRKKFDINDINAVGKPGNPKFAQRARKMVKVLDQVLEERSRCC